MPKIKVKSLLQLLEPETRVLVIFYAYGQYYGDSARDDIETAEQAFEELNYTCLSAYVTKIEFNQYRMLIRAEIVHN